MATRRGMWFQHYGAPAHFSIAVRQLLDELYSNRRIGRGGPISWPARFPDMTPLDFYLWGHLKSVVNETPVPSEQELIGRTVEGCARIRETPGIFERVPSTGTSTHASGGHLSNYCNCNLIHKNKHSDIQFFISQPYVTFKLNTFGDAFMEFNMLI